MKKYILAAIAAVASAACFAQSQATEPADTILAVKNADKVIITENASGVDVNISGLAGDPDFHTTSHIGYADNGVVKSSQNFAMPLGVISSSESNYIGAPSGLHFGFCGAVDAPDAMNTQMGKSFEVGIDEILFYGRFLDKAHHHYITVGVGVNWRNYRMTGENRFVVNEGNVSVEGYPEGVDGKFSRIKMFSLGFPVMYHYDSPIKGIGNSHLGFQIGAVLNWNSHASMLTQWEQPDGTKVKEKTDRVGQRKFTVDLKFAVRLAPAVGIYFKYCPMDMFKSSTSSPRFQTISTGLIVGI